MLQFSDPTSLPVDSIPAAAQEVKSLKNLSLDELMSRAVSGMVDFAIHLVLAILVFYCGKYVIRKLCAFAATVMLRRNVDTSLSTFVLSLIRITLYFILIVIVIGILGINTSSFIALFASAGVAVGMALSGTLQNFAGGVLILLLKPYEVGDYIEAQGFAGKVTEIQIFNTVICTPDNKTILIPNGGLSTGSINNWSKQDYRRVDWTVGITYGDDFATASRAIHSILASVQEVIYLDKDKNIIPASLRPGAIKAADALREANNGAESNPEAGMSGSRETVPLEQAAPAAAEEEATDATPSRGSWLQRLGSSIAGGVRKRRRQVAERKRQQEDALKAFNRVNLADPTVNISALADSSVNLVVRAWVEKDAYWNVYYYVLRAIYERLPAAGISFPFPQLDVHLTR